MEVEEEEGTAKIENTMQEEEEEADESENVIMAEEENIAMGEEKVEDALCKPEAVEIKDDVKEFAEQIEPENGGTFQFFSILDQINQMIHDYHYFYHFVHSLTSR